MTFHKLPVISLAVISCAILLAGCSKQTTNANSNTAPKIAACVSTGLTASLAGLEGTAGTYYTTLTVTNKSATTCAFTGTAQLALLNATGTELGKVSSPDTDLTLTPGEAIYASVAFPDASNFTNTSACKSGGVIVNFFAPNETTPIQAYDTRAVRSTWTIHACPGYALNAFSTTKP
jgi:hypothetical protein